MNTVELLRTDVVLTWAVILASIALIACGGYAAGPRDEGEAEAYADASAAAYAPADAGLTPRECQTIEYDRVTGYRSWWGPCP